MKNLRYTMAAAGLGFVLSAGSAQAMQTATYQTWGNLARSAISQLSNGPISDVSELRALTEKVIQTGLQGANEYSAQQPGSAKLMRLLIDNVAKMRAMSLPEIEEAWHDGNFILANGIDYDFSDTASPDVNHVEAVIHPVTVLMLLNQYEQTKDEGLLEAARDEFSEVLDNIPNS